MSESESTQSEVRALYEAYPYPPVGYWSAFFTGVRWEERPTLNYRAAYTAAFGSVDGAAPRPRILVAGCGTFEPVVVALANPTAEIWAVDLSQPALDKLAWQARVRGVGGRIHPWCGDFQALPAAAGVFDLIVATGVLHHCPDPSAALRALEAKLAKRGLLRLMIYSQWGRALLYGAKELARFGGARTPSDLRALIERLPPEHPYKIYFHFYSDSRTLAGIADGYLHPCDQPFTASTLRDLLRANGLEAAAFLHAPAGQPEHAEGLLAFPQGTGVWERLSALEALGELEENFRFFAARAAELERRRASPAERWEWNEALPERGVLFSLAAGRGLIIDKAVDPASLTPEEVRALATAFFILPGGKR